MTNDLERVTKLAEECGAEMHTKIGGIQFTHAKAVTISTETLLAYTQKVEQAVLAKRDEEVADLREAFELVKKLHIMATSAFVNKKQECESLQAKLAMQAEALKETGYVMILLRMNIKHEESYSSIKKALNATQADVDNWMAKKKAEIEAPLQAKIDALMLEYCPDEMTDEQIENWGSSQVRVEV